MAGELLADRRVGRLGVAAGADLDQVDEQPAALDVGEELVAEPGALRGALDQARDVGEDELAVVAVDRSEHRLEGRERVVGHLRRRPREPGEQRRLAGVGQADQPGVGEQAEAQLDPAARPLQPALGEARRLLGGAGEALVAVPAEPAGGHDRPLARLDQVEVLALEALHPGPRRDQDDAIVAAGAVPVRPLPVPAALGPVVGGDAHRGEVAPRRVADEDDVAPAPAVAAVGPATGHVRLPAEGDDPVAAPPALDEDARSIVKHGRG